jgi:hypothetical protein
MISEWKLQSANIVIPVLSGVTNTKPFKNQKLIETLRNGIKNVSFINKKKKNFFLIITKLILGRKCIRSMVYNKWY